MVIKLPTIKRVYDEETGKTEIIRGELPVEIDTSFRAHLKWEEQFQAAVGYDLTTYTQIVTSWVKDPDRAKAHLVGLLKFLFCFINTDKLPTFRDFCGLFDFEIADEILKKINVVIHEISNTVSKN